MCSVCLCYLVDQACKGPLMDEELGTLLVLVYLAESHHHWLVPLGASSAPFLKFFVGAFLPTVGLMWLASPLDVEGPTSAAIWVSSWVGNDPNNLPTTFSPSNCLSLLLISSCEGGALTKGVPSWGPLLLPTLSVIFILTIWNGAATNQRSWWAFSHCK